MLALHAGAEKDTRENLEKRNIDRVDALNRRLDDLGTSVREGLLAPTSGFSGRSPPAASW